MNEWPKCICCDELIIEEKYAAHDGCTETIIAERDNSQKIERDRVLALIEKEMVGWKDVWSEPGIPNSSNFFAIQSTLIRLRKQVKEGIKAEDVE